MALGGVRNGAQVAMLTTPSTRSGCSAAVSSDVQALLHSPTRTARSVPVASMTAMVSATYSVSA